MMDERVNDLHLLLIFLTGWQEGPPDKSGRGLFKSWNGYLFEVLDDLEARKLIRVHRRENHIVLTDKGKRLARALKNKYLPP